ncbi:MAG: galactofuranosyltransferase [Bacteroides sp.]|nr:galactofuranosyltransferase [Bacteroides sp.]MCM1448371.1 galactofuranosyltransferase [Bacteroides sp.]MCM1516028.1 galactofuranosyltransferase [Paraprevotella sp.]
MIYYLPKDYKQKRINDAGSKARMDIEDIMAQMKMRSIGIQHHGVSRNRIRHFIVTLMSIVRILLKINEGDILIVQYPVKYYSIICNIVHSKKARIIAFIHDLDCFRLKRHSVQQEIRMMNDADALICCNRTICQWLCRNGFVGHNKMSITVPMHIFDFLSDAKCIDRKQSEITNRIVYAGQLTRRKNSFLYSFGNHIHNFCVNVYGNGFDLSKATAATKFDTKGFMLPSQLISCAEGDFGLVWDGDSIDSCNGDWGEYLAMNTPHKISLYIRCGLPIIIWDKAAMAQFVEENEIGICIGSLRDINRIYSNLTQEKYNHMCDNVQRVNLSISQGAYFRAAVTEAISRLETATCPERMTGNDSNSQG